MAVFWLTLSLAVASCLCNHLKILVVYPMPSTSHKNLGEGIVKSLLKAGHEVTYVRVFPYKNPPPNLREVDVSSIIGILPQNIVNIASVLKQESNDVDMHEIKKLTALIATKTLEDKNVQKLINDPKENYDLVLVEYLFSDLHAGFSPIFNCPLIWATTIEVSPEVLGIVDVLLNPAYTPDFFAYDNPPFTFLKRVQNLWSRLKGKYWYYTYYDDLESKEYDRLIAPVVEKRGRKAPTYEEIRYNASLVLGNSHVSMGMALPLPQNYKPIGGYHINEDVQPLPEDIKKIMDNAKDGVIYFSMGSILKSKDWPEDIKNGLLKMFGGLRQTVLWKFEELLPDMPKNVHILHWAPQTSILSHPNCILFISHGGQLSTSEAIHFGVPVIGIPVFGDQHVNVKRSVSKGFAIRVELSYGIVDELKAAIDEITTNLKYTQRVKELSFIYHHRPTKPAAELVHWVEHVAYTRGAPHLRSPGLDVPLYQRLYLDLIAVIVFATTLVIVLLKRICKVICISFKVTNKLKNN